MSDDVLSSRHLLKLWSTWVGLISHSSRSHWWWLISFQIKPSKFSQYQLLVPALPDSRKQTNQLEVQDLLWEHWGAWTVAEAACCWMLVACRPPQRLANHIRDDLGTHKSERQERAWMQRRSWCHRVVPPCHFGDRCYKVRSTFCSIIPTPKTGAFQVSFQFSGNTQALW